MLEQDNSYLTTNRCQVNTRFDSIQLRGLRYPIDQIYKLSRDEAQRLHQSWYRTQQITCEH